MNGRQRREEIKNMPWQTPCYNQKNMKTTTKQTNHQIYWTNSSFCLSDACVNCVPFFSLIYRCLLFFLLFFFSLCVTICAPFIFVRLFSTCFHFIFESAQFRSWSSFQFILHSFYNISAATTNQQIFIDQRQQTNKKRHTFCAIYATLQTDDERQQRKQEQNR